MEERMMGFVITIVFVAVWLLLGRVLFSTSDWGNNYGSDT